MTHRPDDNQAEIVADLRAIGATVAILSKVGNGVPDLLVGWHGVNFLFEVKNLNGRGARVTPDEYVFHRDWKGQANIITDVQGALKEMGAI